ncbi:MAG: N-acetylornithine carbamoyltransferase [Planctomycetota bacterium]
MKHFHSLADIDAREVRALVERTLELADGALPRRSQKARSLGLLFLAPSLRTQASMQRAAQLVGLDVVTLAGNLWSFETTPGAVMDGDRVEHAIEAAGVLGQYVDALGLRAFPDGRSWEADRAEPLWNVFRQHAGVPLVNLESPMWHPCQALADRAALAALHVPTRAKLVVTWAWHPKGLPHAVANSSVCMAAQRGMEVVVCRPRGYDLDNGVIARAERLAAASGGSVRVSSDPLETRDAAVVLAKSWGAIGSWGDPASESARRAGQRHWRVTTDHLAPDAHFFHCLPVRRNVVVDDAVLDGPASRVLLQAKLRLHAQTALLEQLSIHAPTPTPKHPLGIE